MSNNIYLKPGTADYHLRQHKKQTGRDLCSLARAYVLEEKFGSPLRFYTFRAKRGVLLPSTLKEVTVRSYIGGTPVEEEIRAFLELAKMIDVRKISKQERVALQQTGKPSASVGDILENKNVWTVTARRHQGSQAVRYLTQDMESSQVIKIHAVNQSGEPFPHRQYELPSVHETPEYIKHIYKIMEIGLEELLEEEDLSDDDLEKLLRGLNDPTLATCTVQSVEGYTCGHSKCDFHGDEETVRRHYKEAHYTYEEKKKLVASYPIRQYNASVVTAGTPEGIRKAAENLMQNDRNINAYWRDLRCAVDTAFEYCKIEKNMIPAPQLEDLYDVLEGLYFDMPLDASSGPLPVSLEGYKNTEHIRVSNYSEKRYAKVLMAKLTKEVLKKLEEYCRTVPLSQVTIEDLRKMVPASVSCLMTKEEVKTWGEELEKIRLFFIASGLDYMLAYLFLGPIFKHYKHAQGVMVGHKWMDGDATRLYNSTKFMEYLLYLDFSRFDMTLKAALLSFIVSYLSMTYKYEDSLNYRVCYMVFLYLCDRSAVKIVEWLDGALRLVIGMMASGYYDTSMNGSLYSLVVVFMTGYTNAKTASERSEFLKMINETISGKKLHFFLGTYGDNVLFGCLNPMKKYIDLEKIERVARENFKMNIKFKNCSECTTPLSVLDKFGNIRMRSGGWTAPDGTVYERPDGIVVLKKHLIRCRFNGKDAILPFRNTADYVARIGRTVVDIRNPAIEYMRLVNMTMDNCFANPVALNWLEAARRALLLMVPTMPQWLEISLEEAAKDKQFRKMFWKMQDRSSSYINFTDLIDWDYNAAERLYAELNCKAWAENETYESLTNKRLPSTMPHISGIYAYEGIF